MAQLGACEKAVGRKNGSAAREREATLGSESSKLHRAVGVKTTGGNKG